MFIYDHDKYSLLLEIRVHQIYVTKCEYRTQNNSDNQLSIVTKLGRKVYVRLPHFSVCMISLKLFYQMTNSGKFCYHRLAQRHGRLGVTVMLRAYHALRVQFERIVVTKAFEVLRSQNPSQCSKWELLWDFPKQGASHCSGWSSVFLLGDCEFDSWNTGWKY